MQKNIVVVKSANGSPNIIGAEAYDPTVHELWEEPAAAPAPASVAEPVTPEPRRFWRRDEDAE